MKFNPAFCSLPFLSALLAAASFLAWPECAIGEPVYSQVLPEEPGASFGSSDSPISQKVADNFSLSGTNPITVRSIRFVGGSGLAIPPSDDFRIVFLEDMGGEPGAPLTGGDFSIGSAFSRTLTGGQLLNGVTIPSEYVVNLPGGITLSPNTTYWVSISNDLLPVAGWAWARAGGLFDQTTASTFGSIASGPWDTFVNGGMWFELNDQVIPEPSSFAILLLTLMATTLPRSRHYRRRSCFVPTLSCV